MNKPLTGINILVTRPAHQADDLAARICLAGGNPVLFPVLEILDIGDQRPLLDLVARLDEFDLAIFISPNAVNKAMSLIQTKRSLPPTLKVAAVGQGTTRVLGNFGVNQVIAPAMRFDSEALLEMTELRQVQGKRIVIFRGDGGRELLGDGLLARGATLEYAECYRRVKPGTDAAPLLRAGARGEINAITITSSEGLRNLFDMVGEPGQVWLKKTPLFVSHERIAQTARKLGLDQVIRTAAGDEGLVQGLLEYFQPEARGGDCTLGKS
ncbi:uroporphyrinogen-III synthase [Nitrosospira sp. NpAV]|uniref:uroporphyrinogen-III synthase n=1 Tax=Nitrosospira sp. NpAV TaxID=58133 RepID=UPI00059F46F5|nr:uroporphyrinogen-III synthase [Nitrosospira sp. NpAV]KIO48801.1 uroporphyrinogen III synthase [Nitrosospira sp. NpAV]